MGGERRRWEGRGKDKRGGERMRRNRKGEGREGERRSGSELWREGTMFKVHYTLT